MCNLEFLRVSYPKKWIHVCTDDARKHCTLIHTKTHQGKMS